MARSPSDEVDSPRSAATSRRGWRTHRPPPITVRPRVSARALYPSIFTVTIRPPATYLELFTLFTLKVTGKEQEAPPAQLDRHNRLMQ